MAVAAINGRDEMQKTVGEVAGKVFKALETQGTLSVSKLPTAIAEKPMVAYQALGWLAREDKIKYSSKGKGTYVSLV